jgi:hypothetical protein
MTESEIVSVGKRRSRRAELEKLRPEIKKRRQVLDAPFRNGSGSGGKAGPQKMDLPKDARKSLDAAFSEWKT